MAIVRLSSGLGNQLFQIAFGEYLMARYSTSIQFEATAFCRQDEHRRFETAGLCRHPIINKKADLGRWRMYPILCVKNYFGYRMLCRMYPRFGQLMIVDGVGGGVSNLKSSPRFCIGYWQRWCYVAPILPVLLAQFVEFQHVKRMRPALMPKDTREIAIHLRWGDYRKLAARGANYGLLDWDYYDRAIETLGGASKLRVFSDDVEAVNWCRAQTRLSVVWEEPSDPWGDLFAMASYPRLVTANSTFSWWAGVIGSLHNKVAMPARWTPLSGIDKSTSDYLCPPMWHQVENDFLR